MEIINEEEFNFAMTEVYPNFSTWDMPPNIPDDAEIKVFFNYDFNGFGFDTPVFTDNLENLSELFTVSIFSFNDTITLVDQVSFDLLGELGEDIIKLERAFIHLSNKRRPHFFF